jgi:hypothetical protein
LLTWLNKLSLPMQDVVHEAIAVTYRNSVIRVPTHRYYGPTYGRVDLRVCHVDSGLPSGVVEVDTSMRRRTATTDRAIPAGIVRCHPSLGGNITFITSFQVGFQTDIANLHKPY